MFRASPSSSQCAHLATQLSSITTAITGQKAIGSVMQSDLMIGVKTPWNMLRNNWLQIKSLIVASSWSRPYLLIKDARSFEHKGKDICWNTVAWEYILNIYTQWQRMASVMLQLPCNSCFHIVSSHCSVSFLDMWMVQDMDFQGFFFLVCQAWPVADNGHCLSSVTCDFVC